MKDIIMCLCSVAAAFGGAVLGWWLCHWSQRKAADVVAKAIMEMFRDEIAVGIDILEEYINAGKRKGFMPNESFGTHTLSSDVIAAVIGKTRRIKRASGFPPNEFLKHLSNYYLHICTNVNNLNADKAPPQEAESEFLNPARGVLSMVETIIKAFES